MGSTRLPKKVMSDIVGYPMLWHVINRVKKSKYVSKIIVATTTNRKDIKIKRFAESIDVEVFCGSETDVLDRYYQAAKEYHIENIVRITADDPLKDPIIMNKIIKKYCYSNVDYVSNTIKPTYPLGLDVEVFSFHALKRAWVKAKEKYEREHVTPYIWMNPDKFKVINVTYEKGNLSDLRWTVDTKEDLEFIRAIYKKLYKKNSIFLMEDVLKLLEKHPEIKKINENIKYKNIFQ